MKDCLVRVKARKAEVEEVLRFHTMEYVSKVKALSDGQGGDAGDCARFSKGGYEIALYAVGGVLAAVEAILTDDDQSRVENAYCLVRPPGHHAERDQGMGFCIFNNIVLGVEHARVIWNKSMRLNTQGKNMRVAVVDFDVHHGNGTQQAFWDDPDTLFISLHQDSNYPLHTGYINEVGGPASQNNDGTNTTINIPLPPGSGKGAYEYAFDKVVIPALRRFSPDMIFVSSGFDASYADPLAAMLLSAEDYRIMTRKLMDLSDEICDGRLLFSHEGGYSKDYVPYCCLAVVEELCGGRSFVDDSYVDVHSWGYQELQLHQAAVIDAAAAMATLTTLDSSQAHSECTLSINEIKVSKEIEELLCQVEGYNQTMTTGDNTEESSRAALVARKRAILMHLLSNC